MKQIVKEHLRNRLNILLESKATEAQAINILKKSGIESPENILSNLIKIDKSKNQVNLPAMAYLISKGNAEINDLESVFNEYIELVNKKRVKPLQTTKKGLVIGNKVFTDFIRFAEFIHGETSKHSEKPKSASVEDEFEAEDKPIWSGNNIDIYDGNDVGKCIKYTGGQLTGRSYGFCIGQPGNTMFQSYRDSKISTFYFIVDRNKFKKEENGGVNLDDPLHVVVLDNTKYGVELTDANNTTGNIAEFGSDSEGYLNYLKSKGVPVDKLVNKPKTPEEEEEQKVLGRPHGDLEWFKKLSYDYKSKYIGRGHILTDAQFDYLLGSE